MHSVVYVVMLVTVYTLKVLLLLCSNRQVMEKWLVKCLHVYPDIHRIYTCFDKAHVSSIAAITSILLCIHSTLSSPLQSSCEGVS